MTNLALIPFIGVVLAMGVGTVSLFCLTLLVAEYGQRIRSVVRRFLLSRRIVRRCRGEED